MQSDLFFFNDTATTEIYTLSLHDALPIFKPDPREAKALMTAAGFPNGVDTRYIYTNNAYGERFNQWGEAVAQIDRKSTRLNSSHANISYAVFCLKKKNHFTQHKYYTWISI